MDLFDLFAKISIDTSEYDRGLDDASKKFQEIGKTISDAGGVLTKGVTLPLVGAGTAAGKMSLDFEDAIAKVSTIADLSQVPLGDLESAILSLSNQTGISSNEIANNVYDAISAGQKTGDAVNFVGNSTMEQMIDFCAPICVKEGVYPDMEAAKAEMMKYFPKLKRWAK